MNKARPYSNSRAKASCEEMDYLLDEAFAIGLMQIREEIFALSTIVSCLRPRNILEIGSGNGGTFFLWCKLGGDGLRISLDLPGGPYGGEPNGDTGLLQARNERMLGWSPGVRLISGDSRDPDVLVETCRILCGTPLEMLFIDGNHTYEAVEHDYKTFGPLVAAGGLIIFHDINDTEFHQANNVGVSRLWSEIQGTKLEINCRQNWGGIGILRRD